MRFELRSWSFVFGLLLAGGAMVPAFAADPAFAPCKNPSWEELEKLAAEWGKTPDGKPAGLVVVGRSSGAAQNQALGEQCRQIDSWCPTDNVLIVSYQLPVQFWHVEATLERLENSQWYANAPARSKYTKAETVEVFALPDCKGFPVSSSDFGFPNPVPTQPTCVPTSCAGDKVSPGVVIQWEGAVIVPAGVQMAFGFVGSNMWGPGGELQWNVTNLEGKTIQNLPAERWPGE